MPSVTLYGYPTSPYVMKVGCYLKYKRLPFEFVAVNPISPQQIRFTDQRQVPVLSIDDKWRKDSTPLGIWLDDVFPERPILGDNDADSKRILAIDNWVSDHLIAARFRAAVEWERPWDSIRNGWRLATAVHNATPIPFAARLLWPFFVKRAPFIVRMVNAMDRSEDLHTLRGRLCREFIDHLNGGPFLGGRTRPSLADLSAYPIIIFAHLFGLRGASPFLANETVLAWCTRVQSTLPRNPLLIPDALIRQPMFWADGAADSPPA
ncbi:MAG: glutathione S-transferase family protein [Pseudomonadota bacterium]